MRFKQFLEEKLSNRPLIVVDIQYFYRDHIKKHFDIGRFLEDIQDVQKILWFFNGADVGIPNALSNTQMWLLENGADEELINRVYWYEKDYGWFRPWLDEGVPEEIIVAVAREMIRRRVYTSDDVPKDVLDDIGAYEIPVHDPLLLSGISDSVLRRFAGGFICGGGRDECLKEVQMLLDVYNLQAKVIRKYTF